MPVADRTPAVNRTPVVNRITAPAVGRQQCAAYDAIIVSS